jgi:RNase P/RNase MRP subunit p29
MGGGRDVYRVWARKLDGRRLLGRPRRRWEYNIKMDLLEVEGGGMD